MRNVLIILVLLISSPGFGQAILNVKTFGGAMGNGRADDTQAIQKTIDAVSEAGGGTVYFPNGTYRVSPVADSVPIQTICLRIPNNIEIQGESKSKTAIKVIDDAIPYDAIMGAYPSFTAINNFTLHDITINGNGSQNPVTEELLQSGSFHTMVRVFLGNNIMIENCRFTDHKGVWMVAFNGLIDGATVRNCTFDKIGDAEEDWDHSSIYTDGENFRIYNNTFRSRFGAGTFGARTAIETHGKNQYIADNRINGFVNGMNVTGYSPFFDSENQVIINNVFTNVLIGMRLWAGTLAEGVQEIEAKGLKDVLIANNTVRINLVDWTEYEFFNGGSGISFELDNDRPIRDLFLYRNDIVFKNLSALDFGSARFSAGIISGPQFLDPTVEVNDFYIASNNIRNAPGPGISLESVINRASVVNNRIVNPGSNGQALDGFEPFLTGFFLSGSPQQVRINDNRVVDRRSPQLAEYVGIDFSDSRGGSYFFDNADNLSAADGLFVTDETSGPAWKTTPDLPILSFEGDSIAVTASSQVTLTVSFPSSTPTSVRIKVINTNTNVADGLYAVDRTFTLPADVTEYSVNLSLDATELTGDNPPVAVLIQSADYINGRYSLTQLVEDAGNNTINDALAEGIYELHPASAPDKVVETAMQPRNGGNVQQGIDRDQAHQRWQITALENGYYRLVSVANPKQCLDVAGRGITNRTNVQTWRFNSNGQGNQEWKLVLEDAEKGYYSLAPRHTNEQELAMRLDIKYASRTAGTNVWLYRSNGTPAQRFVLEKVDDTNARSGIAARKYEGDEDQHAALRVYPNPASGEGFTVEGLTEGGQVALYDLHGKRIPLQLQTSRRRSWRVRAQRALSPGVYLLKVDFPDGQPYRSKIVIK
jgi:hypothetical protein